MSGGLGEQALSREAVLVRGGKAALAPLSMSAKNGLIGLGAPCLSMFGGEGSSALEIVALVPDLLKRTYYRESTAGALYDLGFGIEKTRGPWHYTIWLPDMEDAVLNAFIGALGPSELNPYPPSE